MPRQLYNYCVPGCNRSGAAFLLGISACPVPPNDPKRLCVADSDPGPTRFGNGQLTSPRTSERVKTKEDTRLYAFYIPVPSYWPATNQWTSEDKRGYHTVRFLHSCTFLLACHEPVNEWRQKRIPDCMFSTFLYLPIDPPRTSERVKTKEDTRLSNKSVGDVQNPVGVHMLREFPQQVLIPHELATRRAATERLRGANLTQLQTIGTNGVFCGNWCGIRLSNSEQVNLVNRQPLLTTYRPRTNHTPSAQLSTTYQPHTDHIPTTYQPHTQHIPGAFTDHIPTAFIDYIPTTYQPHTESLLPTTYRPHTEHIPSAFTDHIPTAFIDYIQTHTNRPHTDHILSTYLPPLWTTYRPHTDLIPRAFTNHIPTSYRELLPTTYWAHTYRLYELHTDHIPTSYRELLPTKYRELLPTTYPPHTESFYRPHTDQINLFTITIRLRMLRPYLWACFRLHFFFILLWLRISAQSLNTRCSPDNSILAAPCADNRITLEPLTKALVRLYISFALCHIPLLLFVCCLSLSLVILLLGFTPNTDLRNTTFAARRPAFRSFISFLLSNPVFKSLNIACLWVALQIFCGRLFSALRGISPFLTPFTHLDLCMAAQARWVYEGSHVVLEIVGQIIAVAGDQWKASFNIMTLRKYEFDVTSVGNLCCYGMSTQWRLRKNIILGESSTFMLRQMHNLSVSALSMIFAMLEWNEL